MTRVPETVYPLLQVGVQELPLARLDVHGVATPFVGAADASHGSALQTAVSVVSVPALHILVPDTVYPLLHVGVHELPLVRVDVHGVATPFVGAADASHGSALQTAVSAVSVPALHVLMPETVYPLLHVGVQELPLAMLDVHGVATPFVGAADASQGVAVGAAVVGAAVGDGVVGASVFAVQTTVSVVSVPAVHVCRLCTSSCLGGETGGG